MSRHTYQARAPRGPKKRKVKVRTPAPCPVCGFLTCIEEARGDYYICPICWWEDEPIPRGDPDFPGAANKGLSYNVARANFAKYGAAHKEWVRHVRDPLPDEIPPEEPPAEDMPE
ncbi:MAG: CPCC family cysteine-rich protein [Erythrobacter sp.]|nr:CPCC family cysteine-rich protein [Erythrobacter sp.]